MTAYRACGRCGGTQKLGLFRCHSCTAGRVSTWWRKRKLRRAGWRRS